MEPTNLLTCEPKQLKPKSMRRRKREFFNLIKNQMEFYFGDANLSKDRFLKKLIEQDPYVPLDVFLNFNKIKKLVSSSDEIAKALSHSDLLQLNEERTKVCRKKPLSENLDSDARTIYVESLPPTADHEWVQKAFARFGNIVYVSLPKFQNSKKIKEFGFVEFEKEESVQMALNAFIPLGRVIFSDVTDPENLMSISTYVQEQKKIETTSENTTIKESSSLESNDIYTSSKNIERKRSTFEDSNVVGDFNKQYDDATEEPAAKRKKLSIQERENSQKTLSPESSDEKPLLKSSANKRKGINGVIKQPTPVDENKADVSDSNGHYSSQEEASSCAECSNTEMHNKSQKKKKRRKCKKKHVKKVKGVDSSFDISELKICTKKDWKRLRNNYLNAQRKKISEMKTELRKKRNSSAKALENLKATVKKPQSMNFYGAGQDFVNGHASKWNKYNECSLGLSRTPLFKYEPELIVCVKLLEACVDVKGFKEEMKQYPGVKYIDVKEGATRVFIRCETAKFAKSLKKRLSCAEYRAEVLSGEADIEYWARIMRDREMKLNKQTKLPRKRGKQKIKACAVHTLFEDD